MNMLCSGIANWCKRNGAVPEEDYPVVLYGIQLFFNTSLKVLGILLIGALLHCLGAVLLSIAVFCSMRYWTGGWHSKSHLGCFFSMMTVCAGPALLTKLDGEWIFWAMFSMFIYSVYAIARYAPCNSEMNPIDDLNILRVKRIGSIVELAGLSIVFIFWSSTEIQMLIIIPLFADAVLLHSWEMLWNRYKGCLSIRGTMVGDGDEQTDESA